MDESELREILERYSTKCFAIEYEGFLSNHVSQGIVALARLRASKERVDQFVTWYRKRLEKPEDNPEEVALPDNQSEENFDYESILGKRVAYFPLLKHYKKDFEGESQGSMEIFISRHMTRMFDGMSGSALHALIQAGYGYNAKCPEIVIEGIAYLHHSYSRFPIPVDSTFGQGTTDILDVLVEIGKDEKLKSFDLNDKEQTKYLPPNWRPGNFQKKLAILAYSRSNQLVSYVDKIQLPKWFKISEVSFSDVMKLCDWVIDNAITVYTASERRNDFFLLHGVTGAWSLKQALSAMEEVDLKILISCIQEFVYVLFSVYVVEQTPKMVTSYLTDPVKESWEEIIRNAINSEKDEHVYKMTQVCYERAQTYPTDRQDVFKRAAKSSLEFEFIFK